MCIRDRTKVVPPKVPRAPCSAKRQERRRLGPRAVAPKASEWLGCVQPPKEKAQVQAQAFRLGTAARFRRPGMAHLRSRSCLASLACVPWTYRRWRKRLAGLQPRGSENPFFKPVFVRTRPGSIKASTAPFTWRGTLIIDRKLHARHESVPESPRRQPR